jgi:hypothetical protein
MAETKAIQDEAIPQDQEIASCGRGVVLYNRKGEDIHSFTTDLVSLPNLTIDFTGIAKNNRSGVASRLLCFAALYCFCNTLAEELKSRNVNIKSLSGRATPTKARDDYNRTRIKRIFIDVEVDVDDKDLPALAECREVMAMGSLITYSMNESIEVDQVIRRVGDTSSLF